MTTPLEEAQAELKRLRELLLKVEFLWGGFCPFCGSHGRHDAVPESHCPAFSGVHEVRVGEPPPNKPVPYDGRH